MSEFLKNNNVLEKIESKLFIDTNSGCFIWTGSTHKFGYGYIRLNKKTYLTHRIVYQIFFGELNSDQLVLHKCDNPPCCNINHLFIGSHKDNMLDMSKKNRWNNQNKNKKHCLNNHEFSPDNTSLNKDGTRSCKKCSKINSKKSFIKNKSKYLNRIKNYSAFWREKNREQIRIKKQLWRAKRKLLGFNVT